MKKYIVKYKDSELVGKYDSKEEASKDLMEYIKDYYEVSDFV